MVVKVKPFFGYMAPIRILGQQLCIPKTKKGKSKKGETKDEDA